MTYDAGNNKLLYATVQLLRNRPPDLSYRKISKEAKLPLRWLEQFAQDKIRNPSVNRIEALYEYLSGTELKV